MQHTEYIEFEILDKTKFEDFANIFNLIRDAKTKANHKTDKYWLDIFPEYALKHYCFWDTDVKPRFETAHFDDKTWHFYSLIEHLVVDIDVELQPCYITSDGKGRLDFFANAYPYGGISGLTVFLNSFSCKATVINDGSGIYSVLWKNDTEFILNRN